MILKLILNSAVQTNFYFDLHSGKKKVESGRELQLWTVPLPNYGKPGKLYGKLRITRKTWKITENYGFWVFRSFPGFPLFSVQVFWVFCVFQVFRIAYGVLSIDGELLIQGLQGKVHVTRIHSTMWHFFLVQLRISLSIIVQPYIQGSVIPYHNFPSRVYTSIFSTFKMCHLQLWFWAHIG